MPNSSRETGVTLDNIIKSLDLKEGIFKFLNDGSLKNMSATSRYWQAAVKDNGKSVFINRAPEAGDNESLKGLLKDAKKITFSSKISYDQVKSFFEGEQSIGPFRKLKEINFVSSNINSADLQEILKKAPNLENINLGGCDDIATEDRKTFNKSEIASLKDKLGIKGTSPPLTSTAVTSAATISSGPAARSI